MKNLNRSLSFEKLPQLLPDCTISNQLLAQEEQASGLLMKSAALLPEIIEVILSDDDLADSIALNSYLHPNGFGKIVLAHSNLDRTRLRLHIWPETSSRPRHEGDLHDHRWPFVSLPILGRFTETRFAEVGEKSEVPGDPVYLYHCHPRHGRDRLYLQGCIKSRLTQVFEAERIPGKSYSCEAGEIHRFEPSSPGLAITLVLTGDPAANAAKVYRETVIPDEESTIPAPTMTKLELKQLLSIVLRKM